MDLEEFSKINRSRCESPTGFNHKLDSWSLSDWLVAAGGELGEAMNVAKKLDRVRDGIPGNKDSESELKVNLARELADTFIYLDLIFQTIGVNMGEAVVSVFNAKSDELGCPIRFGPKPVPLVYGEGGRLFSGIPPWTFLENETLRSLARELFQRLDMTRASDGDYDNAVALLRNVYDRGRSNGVREAGSP